MRCSASRARGWNAAAWAILVAGLLFGNLALAESKVLAEFREGRDFQGEVQRATYDQNGIAWISTASQLFRIESGRPKLVDSRGGGDRRLVLAPGGERYAWLTNSVDTFGRFRIEVMDLNHPGSVIRELQPPDVPNGFSA